MYFVLVLTIISAVLVNQINADYKAAVVEFDHRFSLSPNDTLENNLHEYINYIENARREGVQIIVFPEYGLTSQQIDPAEYAIDVPDVGQGPRSDDYLQNLSDAATEHDMFIVVNLLEKAKNPKNVTIYYNTNIAFNNSGKIVGKYRKINLFNETKITPGDKNQTTAVFKSDFGATFGLISFTDMLHYNHSRSILNRNVTDVISPTAWVSYLPFYHSLSLQMGYALANKVNLLAASLSNSSEGVGGSGIYGKDGTVYALHISGISSSKLLVANVRREIPSYTQFAYNHLGSLMPSSQPEIKSFKASTYFTPSKYVFKQVDLTKSTVNQKLCDGSFCCYFNVTVSQGANTSEIYQFLAFQGQDELDEVSYARRICAIIACETSDVKTCGSRNVQASTSFSQLSVRSSVKDVPEEFYLPILMKTDLTPVLNVTYTDNLVNGTRTLVLNSTQPEKNVVVFAILGRGGSITIASCSLLLIISIVITYLLK